jgi:hypothetical protein
MIQNMCTEITVGADGLEPRVEIDSILQAQRLRVINRLRGRSPTPPPEPEEPPPPDTRKRKPKGFWRRVESWDQ